MGEEHIVLVDDNKQLVNGLADKIEEETRDKYLVDRFYDAKSALKYIDTEIDQVGDKLVLVGSDERLIGMQGHEFLQKLTKTHPTSKKIIFSAWSDVNPLVEMTNLRINGFVNKQDQDSFGDPLVKKIIDLVNEFEDEPKLEFSLGKFTFKQASTLYEKLQFLKKRKEVYLDAGHKSLETLRPEEIENNLEWDKYDLGGIDSIVINPKNRYIVVMRDSDCVGGTRIIDGVCPLENGICYEDGLGYIKGDKFNLDSFREKEIYTREVSRLVVDNKHRTSDAVTLLGLFKMIEQITSEQNNLFCTSKEAQVSLYNAIGFEEIGPRITYSLDGIWVPMMRDRWKAIHNPDSIQGMVEKFHLKAIEPVPALDKDKWNTYSREMNEEAINRGFYVKKNN